MPLIIRLAGTNVEKGNKILKESKIKYIEASTLEDAANKAVAALKKLKNKIKLCQFLLIKKQIL